MASSTHEQSTEATIAAPTLASETVAHIGHFEVRNTLLMAWLTMIVLIGIALLARRRGFQTIPGRFQVMMELVVEGLFNFFDSVLQDRKTTARIFPMIATFFLFIVVANWLGIIPGVNSITVLGSHAGHELTVPLLRSMNADVNVTLAFSLVSVIATQVLGVATVGIGGHMSKYFVAPWRSPIGCFLGILEFIGEFARFASFVFRLFGNIFGEVLLIVIAYLAPYVIPVPFLGLEIFVGFIQALVFSLLTLAFIKMAMVSHGDHDQSKPHVDLATVAS